MRLQSMQFAYCANTRTTAAGTATGDTNPISSIELCTNGYDDNGNGLIDCADSAQCNSSVATGCVTTPPAAQAPGGTISGE